MPLGIYPRTKEHGRKISKTLTGKKRTKKHCENISKSQKGKKLSKEHKESISKTQQRRFQDPKEREKMSKANIKNGGSRGHWQHLSRKVWEEYHGRKIPKGHIIHHKDENWKNIDPTNLELIVSNPRHMTWHAQLRKLKERTEKFLKSLNLNPTQ